MRRQALEAPAQLALPISVPAREARREERAKRPHLRGRTRTGEAQLALPLPRVEAPPPPALPAWPGRLTAEYADAMERALVEARKHAEGGFIQRAAEGRLVQLLKPFLEGEVQHALTHHENPASIGREDLRQEANLRALKLWRGFTPGQGGPGRTLYPAYVKQAVRQHLGNVLASGKLVGPTQWGRKTAARARRREKREGVTFEEALRVEGADNATVLGLTLKPVHADEREAEQLADDRGEAQEERRRLAELGAEARAALRRLPQLERYAVAVPLGLTRKRYTDARLARHLGCTLEELLAARARGLATLREAMKTRREAA